MRLDRPPALQSPFHRRAADSRQCSRRRSPSAGVGRNVIIAELASDEQVGWVILSFPLEADHDTMQSGLYKIRCYGRIDFPPCRGLINKGHDYYGQLPLSNTVSGVLSIECSRTRESGQVRI